MDKKQGIYKADGSCLRLDKVFLSDPQNSPQNL